MSVEYIRYTIEQARAKEFLDVDETMGPVEVHLNGFRASDQFTSLLAAVQPFVQSIVQMRRYEVLPRRWER